MGVDLECGESICVRICARAECRDADAVRQARGLMVGEMTRLGAVERDGAAFAVSHRDDLLHSLDMISGGAQRYGKGAKDAETTGRCQQGR